MANSKLIIYCDGGARGNPGPAAAAFVVYNVDFQMLHSTGVYLGISTNNQAEYTGVLAALGWLEKLLPSSDLSEVCFYLDSLLVVNQLNGIFSIKDQKLKLLHSSALSKIIKLAPLQIKFNYVPRSQNTAADNLVNSTLDSQPSAN